ncbi:MAG: polysaccharide deacetylase family protein [Firmicutes bacterium]|nr:polysaccharide deacetylase family protein [Bacillota bacterium]
MSKAEFGSVRFFKRVITITVAAVIVGLALGFAISFVKYRDVSKELAKLEEQIVNASAESAQGDGISAGGSVIGEAFDYQTMFPDMYVESSSEFAYIYNDDRYFYFTFDGGPSPNTEAILDALSELDIKATFFVSGGRSSGSDAIIKRIYDEGHTIGIYGDTLPANRLYQSVASYLEDFNKEFEYVYSITGEKPQIFRFRGGTVNKYNIHIRQQLTAEMLRRGFVYYDWNAVCGDNAAGADAEYIAEAAVTTAQEKQRIFLLMHDTAANTETADAIRKIAEYYEEKSYIFNAITNEVRPVTFD